MAAPVPYVPTYSFDGYQAANPARPLPGYRLDDELAGASQATTELVAALAQIQRSDGQLKNGIVTVEALSPQILIGLDEPSLWATGVEYSADATVFEGPKLYICCVEHVSGTFATDLAAGKWTQLADFTPPGVVAAENVSFAPETSGLSSTQVQAAILELNTALAGKADVAAVQGLNGLGGQATNLFVRTTSNNGVSVSARALVVADSSGNTRTLRNVNLTMNMGSAALDTGSEAANTWYHIHVFYNAGSDQAVLRASLSPTAPVAPSGYAFSARVGVVRNDNSSNFWRTIQYGRRVQIVIGSNPTAKPVAATSSSSPMTSWAAISVGNFVPPTAVSIELLIQSDDYGCEVAPNPNNAAYLAWGDTVSLPVSVLLESDKIYWRAGGTGNDILVTGWTDSD